MRITVSELAAGYWLASIEGEPDHSAIDRSPDQALATLVRANIRRLGIEAITYLSDCAPPEGSSIPFGQAGSAILHGPQSSGGE